MNTSTIPESANVIHLGAYRAKRTTSAAPPMDEAEQAYAMAREVGQTCREIAARLRAPVSDLNSHRGPLESARIANDALLARLEARLI